MILQISYLPYKQIDKAKWDECIAKSRNRLIYGFSFYLDTMATNWDGLILNDYEAVMPLPWRKKLQVKYLYQPAFMQQGGIFSKSYLGGEVTKCFMDESLKHFKFAEINLNYDNEILDLPPQVVHRKRNNYVLKLENYEFVFQNYDHGFKKSLRRLSKFKLRYEKSNDYADIIRLFEKLYGSRLTSFSKNDYTNFKSVCDTLHKEGKVITRIARDEEQRILAAMVVLKDGQRLYNLLSCITDIGKKFVANDFLYDKIIQEFSRQELVFDLEGSDVKGIAEFYKKLTPTLQPYSSIKYNNLHPLLKVFKK